jgi:hypothetical protein
MSQRLLKALGGITATAVATTMFCVVPAQSLQAEPRTATSTDLRVQSVTATANGPNHFNSSINVDLPAGGTATVTSPSLDSNMKKATVEVEAPLSDDQALFNAMAFEMFQKPTPGKRLLHCIHLTAKAIVYGQEEEERLGGTAAQADDQTLATIYFCLRMAQLVTAFLAEQGGTARSLAGSGCGVLPVQVKTKTEQVNGQYVVSTAGPVTKNAKKAALKVKCKIKGGKFVYTVQPRKKGKSLKSVVGNNLKVGLASPEDAADGVGVKVSFKAAG